MARLIVPAASGGWSRRLMLQTTVLGGLAAACAPKAVAGPPIIETVSGKIQGGAENGVKVFKGVRYGDSTAGAARFLPPAPPIPWTGVKLATTYGAPSPQGRPASAPSLPAPPADAPRSLLSGGGPVIPYSEDCLFLNVWTPATDNAKRPVMVWLHGGGFATGSGSSLWYDGTNLATKQNVVVVTINHRLNVFGYLHLGPTMGEAYADGANAGMLDVVLALKWVRDNIASFGGDPGNVMIFGESGGGRKASVMMNFIPGQGLFQRCAVQSGSALRVDTPDEGAARAAKFLQTLGVAEGDIAALQALSTDTLLAAVASVTDALGQFRPAVETPSLASHPFDPAGPTLSADIPMLIGTNRTEASLFLGNDPAVIALDDRGLLERIRAIVPYSQAGAVIASYKKTYPDATPTDILYMATTDRSYFLDSTIQGERKAAQNAAPAYLYSFYRETPVEGGRYHVPHASEIPFVFDNLAKAPSIVGEVTPEAQKLADTMSAVWANFARTGNPNTDGLPEWAAYDGADRPTMIFNTQSKIENDPRGEQRALMLKFGSQQKPPLPPRPSPVLEPEPTPTLDPAPVEPPKL